uniref:Uncharacterized protein n=1 Tax=Arundo donax TaxID=35708 RepID=A0A0A9AZ36_ARUDO
MVTSNGSTVEAICSQSFCISKQNFICFFGFFLIFS